MKAKYKLLKDLPDLKAGAIFEWDEDKNAYLSGDKNTWIGALQRFHSFTAGTVTQTPEWFEEIKPEPKYILTKQQLLNLAKCCAPSYFNESWVERSVEDFLKGIPVKIEALNNYTSKDMLDFAKFVHGSNVVWELNRQQFIPIDLYLLDKWMQKAHSENCVTMGKSESIK